MHNGEEARMAISFFTNIKDVPSVKHMTFTTFAELERAGKVEFDDRSGELNVNFCRDIPEDYT